MSANIEAIVVGLKGLDEAAQLLGVSTPTLRRLVDCGAIRSVNIGARRLISMEEIQRVASEGAGKRRARKAR